MSFWIKICGITNLGDALAACEAGADAIGFNFFEESRRFIEPLDAEKIANQLPPQVLKVGIFVNHHATHVAQIVELVGLNAVQLHGDEPPSIITALPSHVRVLRAHRCGRDGLAPVIDYLDACHTLGRMPDAVLIDADAGVEFGGSGQLADWATINSQKRALGDIPFLLAGGLTPDNVAAAIAAVAPNGVDVASGVEKAPGRKDTMLVARFVAAARDAAARI